MESTAECGSEGESFLDLVSRAIRDSPTAKFVLDVDGDLPCHTSGIQAFCESVYALPSRDPALGGLRHRNHAVELRAGAFQYTLAAPSHVEDFFTVWATFSFEVLGGHDDGA